MNSVGQKESPRMENIPAMNVSLSSEKSYSSEPNLNVATRGKRPMSEISTTQEFADFRDEMKELFSSMMAQNEYQLQKLFPILSEIKGANSKIEASVSFLSEKNEEFIKKIEQLEIDLKKKDDLIAYLEVQLEETQRITCKKTIEIRNVNVEQTETKEGLVTMISKLAENLGMPLVKSDVSDIYKVSGKTGKTTIIVELVSAMTKEEVLKKTKEYNVKNTNNKLGNKHLGVTKGPDDPIYVVEQLTGKASRLYFLARDLKRSKKFKYCWTSFGRVYLKKEDDSKSIQLKSEGQIHMLWNK